MEKKRYILISAIAAIVLLYPLHQAYTHPFERYIGPVLAASGNHFYFIHTTESIGAGNKDVVICNIDGGMTWGRTWGSPQEETATAITCDSAGDAIFVGNYMTPMPSDQGGYLATPSFITKFGPLGETKWSTNIGWADKTVDLQGVATDSSDNIYVAGDTWWWGPPEPEGGYPIYSLAYVAKFSRNGEAIWAKRWASRIDDSIRTYCIAASDSRIATCSQVWNPTTQQMELVVLSYDPENGNLLSAEGWGLGGLRFVPVAAQFDAAGHLYVCAKSEGSDPDVFLLKFGTSGGIQISQAWGDWRPQDPKAMMIFGDHLFITGNTVPFTDATYTNGFVLWYQLDILRRQHMYQDVTAVANVSVNGAVPLNETSQVYFGTGPYIPPDTNLWSSEMTGDNYFPIGASWTPNTWEDEECAMTMLGEPTGIQIGPLMSHEQVGSFMGSEHLFIGLLKFKPKGSNPHVSLMSDKFDGQAPVTVNFDAMAWCENLESNIVSYEWDFDDRDGVNYADATTTSSKISHTFSTPWFFKISVRVTANDGQTAEGYAMVQVK